MSKKTYLQITIILIFFYVLLGIIVGFLLYKFSPGYYFHLYPIIPGFYMLMALILLLSMQSSLKKDEKTTIHRYLLLRMIKLVITIGSILAYTEFIDENNEAFVIVTIAFYFFYLAIETYIFVKYEKEKNAIQKNKKELEKEK